MENFFYPLVSLDSLIKHFLSLSRRVREEGLLSLESEARAPSGQTGVFKFISAGILMTVRGMTSRELLSSLRLGARSISRRLEQRTDVWIDLLVWLNDGNRANLYRYLRMAIMAMPVPSEAARELASLLRFSARAWAPEIMAEPARYWPEEFRYNSPGRECLEILHDGSMSVGTKLAGWHRVCDEYRAEHAKTVELAVHGVLLIPEWLEAEELERRLRAADFPGEEHDALNQDLLTAAASPEEKSRPVAESYQERILQAYRVLLVVSTDDARLAADLPGAEALKDFIALGEAGDEVDAKQLEPAMLLFQEMMMADMFIFEGDETRMHLIELIKTQLEVDAVPVREKIADDDRTIELRNDLASALAAKVPSVQGALRTKIFTTILNQVILNLSEQITRFAREHRAVFQAVFRRWTAVDWEPAAGPSAMDGDTLHARAAIVMIRLPREHRADILNELGARDKQRLLRILEFRGEFAPALVEDALLEFYYRALDEELFELKDAHELREYLDWYASPRGHFEQGWDFGPVGAEAEELSDDAEFTHAPAFDTGLFEDMPRRIMEAPGAGPARIARLLLPIDD